MTEATLQGETRRSARLVRRWARWLLRGIRVSGVQDIVSGFVAFRLICLRSALKDRSGPLLTSEGWAAQAELLARVAQQARRIATVGVVERHDLHQRPSRIDPWPLARTLWREGGRLKIRSGRPQAGPRGGMGRAEDEELEESPR